MPENSINNSGDGNYFYQNNNNIGTETFYSLSGPRLAKEYNHFKKLHSKEKRKRVFTSIFIMLISAIIFFLASSFLTKEASPLEVLIQLIAAVAPSVIAPLLLDLIAVVSFFYSANLLGKPGKDEIEYKLTKRKINSIAKRNGIKPKDWRRMKKENK
ncbi:hypothetical protein ACUY3L_09030 [Corynebacterium mastitidis]